MGNIVESMIGDIKRLKSDDVVVIWGGSNDISKNNSKEALNPLTGHDVYIHSRNALFQWV